LEKYQVLKGGEFNSITQRHKRPLHPIDRRLKEMGQNRTWLAGRIGKTPQCIGLYCNNRRVIVPDSGFANLVCRVLGVDINYLIMGRLTFAQQNNEIRLKR
jgi:hypothetical protein